MTGRLGSGAVLIGTAAAMWLGAAAPAGAVCSVFDAKPCTPTVCSVFDEAPCIPEIQPPIGGDLRWTVVSVSADAAEPRKDLRQKLAQGRTSQCPPKDPPPAELNTIQDVFTAFCACWRPPPESDARPGMEITVRFSFNRGGEILGEPRFTFVTPGVSSEVRAVYKRAVADTLARCTPLPFTPALGNALAGRPFALRFIDDRGTRKVEQHGRQ
jgi:hypothetical protein